MNQTKREIIRIAIDKALLVADVTGTCWTEQITCLSYTRKPFVHSIFETSFAGFQTETLLLR